MQDLENDGPIRRAGKCRTWKIMDQIAGLENEDLENDGPKSNAQEH